MNQGVMASLAAAGKNMAQRIRSRPDSEFQQAVLRAVIMSLVYAYFFFHINYGETDLSPQIKYFILHLFGPAFLLSSFAILIRIALDDKVSPLRRVLGATLDISACSFFIYLTNEAGAVLLAVYLWVTLGNGFRYGNAYLAYSAGISLAGFSLVIWLNPYWQTHRGIAASMFLMLVLIPLYSAFLIRQLQGAVKRAKEASLAKSVFLANMSHELRTPLNGVIGIADLLRETPLNKEQGELTQAIHSSAQTLQKLIENVLDISRIEAGKLSQALEDFDLHQLLNSTVFMLEPQGHKKGLLLATHIAPQTPYLLHGDVQHLRQVLINLIGNAIKFTEHGRVDVYVRPFTQGKKPWLRFEVVDSGIGIPVEKQGSIFESFTQADASITRRYGGTGLGTTISKQLVELMGGRIGLISQPGDGSTFWFEIPAQERKAEAEVLPGRLRVGTLVGMDLGNRLGMLIRSWDGEAMPMNAPAGAVMHLLSQASETLDALVVERSLLGTDPALFVRLLHDCPGLGHLPVILIDSDASDHHDQTWLKAGYTTVLHNPVNPTLLFNALHEAASHRELPENVVSLADHFQAKAGRIKLRILVAEDNPVNQRVMRGLLEHAGHEAVMAANGEEALALLESSADQFSLAIMDMHMPVMSGPEAVKRWRFMEKGHLPIIMLTADAREEAEQQCRESGADDFLTKPINSRTLLEMLGRHAQQVETAPVKRVSRKAPDSLVLDETVLIDLAEVGGGLDFIRDLIEDFRQDSLRALQATELALTGQDFGAWKDQLHMLKGGARDVGAVAMSEVCAEAERIKPYEIAQSLAVDRLARVREAQGAALVALDHFLARQRNALRM